MPCWVNPSIAAELWGISLDRVLEQVRAGEVPSKVEDDRLLIDVIPKETSESASDASPSQFGTGLEKLATEATMPQIPSAIEGAGSAGIDAAPVEIPADRR